MAELRILTDAELKKAYNEVMKEAFPPEELKPLSSIKRMRGGGFYDALGLFEGDEPLGYAFLWKDENPSEKFALLDYLCVPKGARNGGTGGRILTLLRQKYPDYVIIGESEAPKRNEEDELILRRLAFYERNGGKIIGYDTALFGVHYKTIIWTDHPVSDEEVLSHHSALYMRQMGKIIYSKFIQIPLAEGEALKPSSPWRV